jgi:conjugative relaxase-like TrwC/TraI family protein
VLTLRPVRVAVGQIPGESGDAVRIAEYLLDRASSPQAFAHEGDEAGGARANAVWLGSDNALRRLGLAPGQEVVQEDLMMALEGRHAVSKERVRGNGSVVRSQELTFSVPKSVSDVWSQASMAQRAELEQIVLTAVQRTLEYLTQTKEVVRRRVGNGERVSEVARGVAAAATLHVISRVADGDVFPAPQLHVHCEVLGVENLLGELVSFESRPWYRRGAPLEGGAMFRAWVADGLVMAGYRLRTGTGAKGRYFEIEGVPESLIEATSHRARDVRTARRQRELVGGGPLSPREVGLLAVDTRQDKALNPEPRETAGHFKALGEEHGFVMSDAAAIRGKGGYEGELTARLAAARRIIVKRMRKFGPTVSTEEAMNIVLEVAPTLMTPSETLALVEAMQRDGELLALKGRRGTEVTTPDIRALEEEIMESVVAAATRGDAPLSEEARQEGQLIAEARLGASLADEQRDAFLKLTSGPGWAVLTGPAGAGKGPTLHAVAGAYKAEGWQVLACGLDGSTAERLGRQITSNSRTIAQLLDQLDKRRLRVDDRTVILIDEATKVGEEEWALIAKLVARRRARVVAVGDPGQIGAIRLGGMFEYIASLGDDVVPRATLEEVRRHRDLRDRDKPASERREHPWLGDYLDRVRSGWAMGAVRLLVANDAIKLYDTREEAMQGMVDEWNEYRHEFDLEQSLLVVQGSNEDVDQINVLAQQCRLDADVTELGVDGVKAVDRDYELYAGDLVVLRNSPYYPEHDGPGSRPERVQNGKMGMVEAVDPVRETVTVSLITDGDEPRRRVTFDLRRMRADYVAWQLRNAADPENNPIPPPALRLGYASHANPAQGATVDAGARFGVSGNEASYSGDARFRYRFSVHLARVDLGSHGESDRRLLRNYARMTRRSQARHPSLALPLADRRISVDEPQHAPAISFPSVDPGIDSARGAGDAVDVPTITRSDVKVPDVLLDRIREVVGRRSADVIEDLAVAWEDELIMRDEVWLRETAEAAAESYRQRVRDAVELERRRQRVEGRLRDARREFARLEDIGGQRPRGERQEPSRAAHVRHEMTAQGNRELKRLQGAEQSQAMSRWRESAALWVAIEREIAIRQEVDIRNEIERSLWRAARRSRGDSAPSAFVRDRIGHAPDPSASEHREWLALARELERDRITAELAAREGVEPARRPRREREELDRRVREFQEAHGIEPATREPERAPRVDGPGMDAR